jgi:hypothetical protein
MEARPLLSLNDADDDQVPPENHITSAWCSFCNSSLIWVNRTTMKARSIMTRYQSVRAAQIGRCSSLSAEVNTKNALGTLNGCYVPVSLVIMGIGLSVSQCTHQTLLTSRSAVHAPPLGYR